MTITLGTAPNTIGPGMRVSVTGLSGPIPNDDILQVVITVTSTGAGVTYGSIVAPTTGFNLVTIGYDGNLKRVADGLLGSVAQGTACSAQALQFHHNGTLVDSSSLISYGTLDTLAYSWALIRHAGESGGASLQEILDAVRTTFPATS
jgi:hypothetical protein